MIFRNFAEIWSFLSRLDEVSSENGHLFEMVVRPKTAIRPKTVICPKTVFFPKSGLF